MKLPLPDFKTFKSRKKEPSPLIAFYNWVMMQVMPAAKELYENGELSVLEAVAKQYKKSLDVTKVGLTEQDANTLRAMQVEWYQKKQKFTKERAVKAESWENFDIGPKIVDYKDKTIQSGYVHIEPNYLTNLRK